MICWSDVSLSISLFSCPIRSVSDVKELHLSNLPGSSHHGGNVDKWLKEPFKVHFVLENLGQQDPKTAN